MVPSGLGGLDPEPLTDSSESAQAQRACPVMGFVQWDLPCNIKSGPHLGWVSRAGVEHLLALSQGARKSGDQRASPASSLLSQGMTASKMMGSDPFKERKSME